MVEVFKTNVKYPGEASRLVLSIQAAFPGYNASFDLEDCDRILRVECAGNRLPALPVLNLLKKAGYDATVLPDEVPVKTSSAFQ